MSHSKIKKRGRSQYVEVWNPRAKRFVVSCALCGDTGFSPTILDDGFAHTLENRAIRKSLPSVLKRLSLDPLGQCPVCAERAELAE